MIGPTNCGCGVVVYRCKQRPTDHTCLSASTHRNKAEREYLTETACVKGSVNQSTVVGKLRQERRGKYKEQDVFLHLLRGGDSQRVGETDGGAL